MKLKYYLRGLGVGIICTAIIMGIALSGNKKETLTDAEIIERARLLGMVMEEKKEESTEQESVDKQKENEQKNPENLESEDNKIEANEADKKIKEGKEPSKENEEGQSENDKNDQPKEDGQDQTENDENGQPDKDGEDQQKEEESIQTSKQDSDNDVIVIEIVKGDHSGLISQKLFHAGLISDATAFDRYLTQNGLDESLRIGVHRIPVGASRDEIIEILQK